MGQVHDRKYPEKVVTAIIGNRGPSQGRIPWLGTAKHGEMTRLFQASRSTTRIILAEVRCGLAIIYRIRRNLKEARRIAS